MYKLELHYYLKNNSHALDAMTRNKCEHEYLSLVLEIARLLDIDIDIISLPSEEGGFREYWDVLGKNSGQITVVLALIAIIISLVPNRNDLKVERLENEIKNLKEQINNINNEKVKREMIVNLSVKINQTSKIANYKSNFYDTLQNDSKIEFIDTSVYANGQIIEKSHKIKRDEFPKFIINKNKLPVEIIENAKIEIISPVMRQGRYRWKGIYKGETIDFYMLDKNFKSAVLNNKIDFNSSFFIECRLEIKKMIDDLGNIKIKSYYATLVLSYNYNDSHIETLQGKKYIQEKKFDNLQTRMFID